jgi:hypothetical protein
MQGFIRAASCFTLLAFFTWGCGMGEEPLSPSEMMSAAQELMGDSQEAALDESSAAPYEPGYGLRYGQLTWRTVGPRTAEFSALVAFGRTYPGSGPDGLAVTGDIFSQGLHGTTLNFGDGLITTPVMFEVIDYDVAENWVLGRAVTLWSHEPLPGTGVTVAETERNDSISTANSMNIGDDYLSNITQSGDRDYVRFTLTERKRVSIRTVLETLTDSMLTLYSSSGQHLASNDNVGGDLSSHILVTLDPGTYYIQAESRDFYSRGRQLVQLRQFSPRPPSPITYTYAGDGPYRVAIGGCCRRGTSYSLQSSVRFDLANSSPVSSMPQRVEAPINTPGFSFQVPAVDAEGDQLTYRLATYSDSAYLEMPQGLRVSSSGLVTWSTVNATVGQLWPVQIVIEERRNGQLIGSSSVAFFLEVVTQTSNPPACSLPPQTSHTLHAGETLHFGVVATDPDAGDVLRISATGVPPGVELSPWLPLTGPSGIEATFTWRPPDALANQAFSVNFTVRDAGGRVAPCTVNIHVLPRSPEQPPEVNAGPDQSILEGGEVTLSGSAITAEGLTVTYHWSLLKSTSREVTIPSPDSSTTTFTVKESGVYTFLLTVTDNLGNSSSDKVTVTVDNVEPVVEYLEDQTFEEGTVFSASGSFSDPGADLWTATVDYGDGSGEQPLVLDGNSFQLNYLYADSGSYIVTITITDDEGATGYAWVYVDVTNIAPKLSVSGGSSLEGSPFIAPVSFTDPSGTSWWAYVDYGDNSSEEFYLDSHSFTLNHVYNEQGTYQVFIYLSDEDGGIDEVRVQVEVHNVAPTVTMTCTPSLDEGSPFSCSGTITDPGPDTQYLTIDYGDGDVDWGSTWADWPHFEFTHYYLRSGRFFVTLTVTDDDGAEATTTAEVIVNNLLPVVEAVGGTIDEGEYFRLEGSFTDADWFGPWEIRVDYGDGSEEEVVNGYSGSPFSFWHYYADNGVYTVTIRVTDHNGGVGMTTVQVVANNRAPMVWAYSHWGNHWGLPVYLEGSAIDAQVDMDAGFTASWALGDGTSAPGFVPEASYANPGNYVAVLTVTDKDGGAGMASAPVEIMKRPSSLFCPDTTTVAGVPATLSAQLMDELPDARLGGREITFQIGESMELIPGTTDEAGLGSVQGLEGLAPGSYTVIAAFAEDSHYLDSYADCTLTVTAP